MRFDVIWFCADGKSSLWNLILVFAFRYLYIYNLRTTIVSTIVMYEIIDEMAVLEGISSNFCTGNFQPDIVVNIRTQFILLSLLKRKIKHRITFKILFYLSIHLSTKQIISNIEQTQAPFINRKWIGVFSFNFSLFVYQFSPFTSIYFHFTTSWSFCMCAAAAIAIFLLFSFFELFLFHFK